MQIFKNFLKPTLEQVHAIGQVKFKPCPEFLGNFEVSNYGHPYGQGKKIPDELRPMAKQMASVHPEQSFNAAFIQRYSVGCFVKPHKDPRTNVGYTLILILGNFDGAVSQVHDYEDTTLQHGDMMSLECTINSIQGPVHQVTPVLRGTRYALILNTCI